MGDAINTQINAEGKVIGKPFGPGNPGRPKGSTNHLSKTVKETVLAVFQDLQGDPKNNLKEFAKKYPRDFYNIAAKLIPQDIKATVKVVKVTKINLIRPSQSESVN